MRSIGASSSSSASHAAIAAISAAMPQVAYASSTIASRPVFANEARIVALSSGKPLGRDSVVFQLLTGSRSFQAAISSFVR